MVGIIVPIIGNLPVSFSKHWKPDKPFAFEIALEYGHI